MCWKDPVGCARLQKVSALLHPSQGCSWHISLRFFKLKYLRARRDRNPAEFALVGGSSFTNLPSGFSFGVPAQLQPHTPTPVATAHPQMWEGCLESKPCYVQWILSSEQQIRGENSLRKNEIENVFSVLITEMLSCTLSIISLRFQGLWEHPWAVPDVPQVHLQTLLWEIIPHVEHTNPAGWLSQWAINWQQSSPSTAIKFN